MELLRDEEEALDGRRGEALKMAYRVLVAAGEAMGAERLARVSWAHLSGVNYNTIGDAGERFLADISRTARVAVRATLNPMGYDASSDHGLPAQFVEKQESIAASYRAMGVEPTFSCVPYDIFELPGEGSRVAFAESNAAIYANSVGRTATNKESAFSALASALTGSAPVAPPEDPASVPTITMDVREPDEVDYGLLGYFAGRCAGSAANLRGAAGGMDRRKCKALCGGMGTSGTCSRFTLDAGASGERIEFGKEERAAVRDELCTAGSGDMIVLGSPQLGAGELEDLASMIGGRSFKKRCLVFCPRAARDAAASTGALAGLERAGCEVLADCCACLTPLITRDKVDSVTTNSIKGAYYLGRSNRVGVDLRPLSEIVEGESS